MVFFYRSEGERIRGRGKRFCFRSRRFFFSTLLFFAHLNQPLFLFLFSPLQFPHFLVQEHKPKKMYIKVADQAAEGE